MAPMDYEFARETACLESGILRLVLRVRIVRAKHALERK
jgi:hypothetical protein